MIKFRCPNCTQKIGVNDEGANVPIACPTCAQTIVIPPATAAEFRPPVALELVPAVMEAAPLPFDHAGRFEIGRAQETAPTNGAVQSALLPHLAKLMMDKLVQALVGQRRQLLQNQSTGTEQLAALEQRLVSLQDAYAARLKTYQVKLADLEQQLAARQEENALLRREKFLLNQQLETLENEAVTTELQEALDIPARSHTLRRG